MCVKAGSGSSGTLAPLSCSRVAYGQRPMDIFRRASSEFAVLHCLFSVKPSLQGHGFQIFAPAALHREGLLEIACLDHGVKYG